MHINIETKRSFQLTASLCLLRKLRIENVQTNIKEIYKDAKYLDAA